jgi:hypothetical protein
MPGFIIKNETQWPLTISLDQVGPLYYGLTKPGEEFVRSTGAVWFTISARVSLDEKCSIGPWDVAIPIVATTGGILLAAVTGGASAFLSVTSSIGASALVSGGLISMSSIVVQGAVVEAAGATPAAAAAILGKVFQKKMLQQRKGGVTLVSGGKDAIKLLAVQRPPMLMENSIWMDKGWILSRANNTSRKSCLYF